MVNKNTNVPKRSGESSADDARLSAVKLIYLVTEEKSFINLTIDSVFDRFDLTNLDRSFATAIAYGTLSDSAACNESVKIAKASGKNGSASFINAIMRSIVREKEAIREKVILNPKKFYLKCGLPSELAGYFKKWFGEERAISICKSMRETPLIGIRISEIASTMEYVKRELDMQECDVYPGEFMENALLIKTSGVPVEKIPAFIEGDFTVQDESAMLVSHILSPSSGSIVVDVCSAPGGKPCHLAEIMRNKGIIYALDISK